MEANTNVTPAVDEPVLVEFGTCECLGYLDSEGKWRNWYSDKVIEGVIEWIPLYQKFRLVV